MRAKRFGADALWGKDSHQQGQLPQKYKDRMRWLLVFCPLLDLIRLTGNPQDSRQPSLVKVPWNHKVCSVCAAHTYLKDTSSRLQAASPSSESKYGC